ncbi:MAG: hypothetical protein HQK86_09350 [Nitrospinae bacterium]|nr:hypothetical protein [Nitrospinota bacterium]MBF0633092.1 hypothetical protein [Nitrospinota bacterium]
MFSRLLKWVGAALIFVCVLWPSYTYFSAKDAVQSFCESATGLATAQLIEKAKLAGLRVIDVSVPAFDGKQGEFSVLRVWGYLKFDCQAEVREGKVATAKMRVWD